MIRALLLSTVLASAAWAQGPAPGVAVRFDHLGLEDGLSQSSVLAVVQDRHGFLWFGTQDGLNRYDGVRLTAFRHDPTRPDEGLPTGFVQSLAETSDGGLWVGTWGGGVARRDPVTGAFEAWRHDPDDPTSLPGDIVTALHEDRAGRLWIGTEGGLAWRDPRDGTFHRYAEAVLPDPFVWSLAEDEEGGLWIGTFRAGAVRVDPASGRWRPVRHDPENPATIGSDDNALVRVTPDGTVWIGTGAGLNEWNGTGWTRHAPSEAPGALCGEYIYDVRQGRDGSVWVATGDGGLCRRATGTEAWQAFRHNAADPTSLPKDVVRALWEDRAGTLWIGTDGGGAAATTGASERMGLYLPDPLRETSLPYPYVWALHQTRDGRIWAGTDGGGLARLDPASGIFETYRHRPGDPSSLAADVILALEESRDGRLWVGTFDAGIDRLDPTSGRIEHFPADDDGITGPASVTVTALHEADDGALWVGTWEGGISRYAEGAWTTWRHDPDDPASLPNDVVTALRPARDGGLWIGTYGGGLVHRATDGTFRQWDGGPGEALAHATVYGVHEDETGLVWIATAGGGLNRLDPATDAVRVLTTRDGLPHNIVYGVLPGPEGALWLSTNAGLARLDPARLGTEAETVEPGAVRVFGPAQGTQGSEFNSGSAFRAADGSLLFGGTNGFNWFDPRTVGAGEPPGVVLTGLRRFDEPVSLGRDLPAVDALALSHRDNFVTVEFAAPGAPGARDLRYAYQLQGVDPEWRETSGSDPEASYTDLPPGRYTFEVRAASPDGAWGPTRTLGVRVVPPWWRTWWAQTLAALLVLGSGLALGRGWQRRREREAAREREEEAEAQRQMTAAREAERLRLARDLHDGPLQDLYGDRFRLEALGDALSGDQAPDVARAQHTTEAVEGTLRDVGRQLRAVCTELRPPVLGAMGVARALAADAERIAEAHPGVALDLDLAADGLSLSEGARVAVYRIAQEAIRNAFRHAEPSRLHVASRETDGTFTVTVEDDGRGFDPPARWAVLARDGHLGLAGASERAAAVGGRFDVQSRLGAGTTVSISVPLDA
ncbi:MAG: two-component regulator propeller domain-containing protein [Bacteroidota bacterium]